MPTSSGGGPSIEREAEPWGGVGLGLAGAFWLSPLMAAFLFGVDPFDPVTYGGVAALFLVASAAAAYLPARRLLRVDPVTVLKAE